MPLDPLQEEVARLALHLAEAGHVALAGGGAMLAHEFVDRPTMDLDLFTSDPDEVGPVTDALHKALHERGYAVQITRREDTFSHLQVTAPDGRQVDVELAQDARMLPAVQLAVGAVLHPDELAADKTLALFGRGAARDLVDVDALAGRYGHARLLELAAAKDAAARPAQAFAELGVDEQGTAGLQERTAAWRAELGTGPDPNIPSNPDAPNDPAVAPELDEETPVTRPACL